MQYSISILLGAWLLGSSICAAEFRIEPFLGGPFPSDSGAGPQLTAYVFSEFELRSVTATYRTQVFSLTNSSQNFWAGPVLDISAVPAGEETVQFTATDVFGTAVKTNGIFRIDRLPVFSISAPTEGALAGPLLRTEVHAQDDLSLPLIQVQGASGETFLRTNSNHAAAVLDLSQYEESVQRLYFYVTDETRSINPESRYVLSLSNPRYQVQDTVPGVIMDANLSTILFTNANREVLAFNRSSKETTLLARDIKALFYEPSGERYFSLTPTGALLWEGPRQGDRRLEIRNGASIEHGPATVHIPDVNGRYGILYGTPAYVRDFVADTNYVVPRTVLDGYLAADGTLIFQDESDFSANTSRVFIFKAGELTEIIAPTNSYRAYLQTDGTNHLWLARHPETFSFEGPWTINLKTPNGLVILNESYSAPSDLFYIPAVPTMMNEGWVAFPKLGGQRQQQIWLRSPTREITQATFYSASSILKALGPNGDLVTTLGNQQPPPVIYTPKGKPPIRLSNDFGARYFFMGPQLYAYWGGTLFKVSAEGQPVAISSLQLDNTTGTLSYHVTATTPASFLLQHSTNLTQWTDIDANSVSTNRPVKFYTATKPGFFRLRIVP